MALTSTSRPYDGPLCAKVSRAGIYYIFLVSGSREANSSSRWHIPTQNTRFSLSIDCVAPMHIHGSHSEVVFSGVQRGPRRIASERRLPAAVTITLTLLFVKYEATLFGLHATLLFPRVRTHAFIFLNSHVPIFPHVGFCPLFF